MSLNNLSLAYIKFFVLNIPKSIKYIVLKHNFVTIKINPLFLIPVLQFLKKNSHLQFKTLVDIIGVDYPTRKKRFTVIYNLLSVSYNERIFIKCSVSSLMALPSVIPVFSAAGWFEREVWDMFGIFFINNFDLRRILTDYGFEGHPFRKDFPLTGYTELRYDENQKRIVSEFLEISQEYRSFDFLEG